MAKNKKISDDPYAAMVSGGTVEETNTVVVDPPVAPAPEAVEEPPPLDVSIDEMASALTTGASMPERKYKSDADPLMLESLELLERIHAGGLLYPSAYTVYDMTLDLIYKIRKQVVDGAN